MMPASTDAFSSGSGRPTDRGLRAFVACVIGVTSVRFVCAIVENWQSLGAHAEDQGVHHLRDCSLFLCYQCG